MKDRIKQFISNHVKLVTFLTVITLFLLICGPIFVLEAREYWGAGMDTRKEMTSNDVIVLSELDETLYVDQITGKYRCKEKVGKNEIRVTVEIKPRYTLDIRADKNTRVIVYCELLDNENNEQLNVLTDDIRSYIKHVEKYD